MFGQIFIYSGTNTGMNHLGRITMDLPTSRAFDIAYHMVLPILWFCLAISFVLSFVRFIHYVWWTPRRLRIIMEKQGVRGPAPRFLVGNVAEIKKLRETVPNEVGSFRHDMLDRICPEYTVWSRAYGKRHLIWWGPEPGLVISNVDTLKEIFSQEHALTLGKPYLTVQKFLEPITGRGLVTANGQEFVHQKRIIAPAFSFSKIKGFVGHMVTCTEEILAQIDLIVKAGNGRTEVEIGSFMTRVTADIIAHTQFGSSYQKGREIFQHLDYLRDFVFRNILYYLLPGSRFFPFRSFREMRKLKKNVEDSIADIISERKNSIMTRQATSHGTDLLGLMLAESEGIFENGKQTPLTIQQLVDECRTFFFAGHETTAKLVTWCVLLLAANPKWQEYARAEALNVCQGSSSPNAESISKMKILEMIIYETLRLYPVVVGVARLVMKDMKLEDLFVPKGMSLVIPIIAIHQDRELWGEDVHEFKPDRFAHGLGQACKHPMAFLPFGHGPRSCIGQSFAMMEAKVVLSMLLMRFRFFPSAHYKHAPQSQVTVTPMHGAQVIVESANHS